MNPISTKAESRLNLLSMIGPASVILSILALVIKESPVYIDLSATALLGLLLSWRFKILGLCGASILLNLVLAYNFFQNKEALTLWELGLAGSLELSFVVTAFASAELKDVFQKACKAACENALLEIEEWKEKITATVSGKEKIANELELLKDKLLPLQDSLKSNIEQKEMFERLLEMAKTEVLQLGAEKEKAEQNYYALKNETSRLSLLANDSEEEAKSLNRLNQKLQEDIKALISSHTEKESQINTHTLNVLDLEWKIEKLNDEVQQYKSKLRDAQGEAQSLGEKLEALIDKLKNLQTEKDDLEKALAEALNPTTESADPNKELKRVNGLYNQLREQFKEKSQVLDETRRTLFQVQEEYNLFQKSKVEEQIQEQEAFQSHILSLSEHIQQLETEVKVLHELEPHFKTHTP